MNFERTESSWSKSETDPQIEAKFSAAHSRKNTSGQNFFTRISELELKPPQWLINDILEQGALIGLVGASGCGKSFLALDMACSIACGADFHGRRVKKGKVLYIAGEGQREITARVAAWCRSNNIEVSQLDLHISTNAIPMHDKGAIGQILREAYLLSDVTLVVIDTLARTFGGHNENSTQDMNHFITNCDVLKSNERSVIIVHHSGHNDERARGNSAFYAVLDAEIFLRKIKNDVSASCTKMKDAPDFGDLNFLLMPYDLDVDGTDFQSCYLQEVVKSERPLQLKDNPKLALDTLISGTKDNVPQGSLHLEEWRRLFYAGHTGDNEDTKKKAFLRARKSLVDKGFVEVTDDICSVRDSGT